MKILIISTSIYPLPPEGYSGIEMLVYNQARELVRRGHQVAVVAPKDSQLGEDIELIPVEPREAEESYFKKYRDRLGEFDIIWDHTWQSWAYTASVGREPNLPIVKTYHTVPGIWGSPPPVQHPCLVGLSRNQSRSLSMQLGVAVEFVYNGLDVSLYSLGEEERNGRWLWIGRYMSEKGPLEAAQMAKRLRIPLDMYGDTEMVSSQEFVDRCRAECDGVLVQWHPGVSREETIKLFQTYKALLFLPNWEEAFGMTVVEAQLCGLPVVTLNRGAMREVVRSRGGFVCEDAAEVERVIQLDRVAGINRTVARSDAMVFSMDAMASGYERLFRRVEQGKRW